MTCLTWSINCDDAIASRKLTHFLSIVCSSMLHCLHCDERLQENDSIHKIDAFFAYHRDCLQCAHCCRLLQSGDSFILYGASAYCVTKRTQTGHNCSASCWLQVINSESPRVYMTEVGQNCLPHLDSNDQNLTKRMNNPVSVLIPEQEPNRTNMPNPIGHGSVALETCTTAVEREIQELRITQSSMDQSVDKMSGDLSTATSEYSRVRKRQWI